MYSANNPVNAVDLDGRIVTIPYNKDDKTLNNSLNNLKNSGTGKSLFNLVETSPNNVNLIIVPSDNDNLKSDIPNAINNGKTTVWTKYKIDENGNKIDLDKNSSDNTHLDVYINESTWNSLGKNERSKLIGHEFEHVKQFLESKDKNKFKGSDHNSTKENYINDPLEKEAFEIENKIYNELKNLENK